MRLQARSKILLVLSRDDELAAEVREAARVILEQPEPVVVRNGAACQAALKDKPAALLILDDEVQRSGGPVLLYRLRSQNPQLRIVYVAHRHTPELELEVRQIGVLFYTSKPIDCWELACLIAGFMGLRVMAPRPGPCSPSDDDPGARPA